MTQFRGRSHRQRTDEVLLGVYAPSMTAVSPNNAGQQQQQQQQQEEGGGGRVTGGASSSSSVRHHFQSGNSCRSGADEGGGSEQRGLGSVVPRSAQATLKCCSSRREQAHGFHLSSALEVRTCSYVLLVCVPSLCGRGPDYGGGSGGSGGSGAGGAERHFDAATAPAMGPAPSMSRTTGGSGSEGSKERFPPPPRPPSSLASTMRSGSVPGDDISSTSSSSSNNNINNNAERLSTRSVRAGVAMSAEQRAADKAAVVEMFYYAYEGYLEHAFPQGELGALSCTGRPFDLIKIPAVTLVDTLDTLAILGNASAFRRAVELIHSAFPKLSFDFDVNVSVFESNIRLLGGLLSGHILAADPALRLYPPAATSSSPSSASDGGADRGEAASSGTPETFGRAGTDSDSDSDSDSDATATATATASASASADDGETVASYDGSLLALAVDLADRLMPAFETPTKIPYGTVNLRHGVPKGETVISSLAGAVSDQCTHLFFVLLSLLLKRQFISRPPPSSFFSSTPQGSLTMEFTMLSELTGDPKYAEAAQNAALALFDRRSPLGLFGKHVNIRSGKWTESVSGIGSNSDSFYEYLLKMYVLFGDEQWWWAFLDAYGSVQEHLQRGDWYCDVDVYSAKTRRQRFENLMAFWPGVQALMGELPDAVRTLNAFYLVWRDWGFVPEEYDFVQWQLSLTQAGSLIYPLRPELIESTYLVHRATGDDSWLWAGHDFLESLQKWTRTDCGYAAVKNVATLELDDTMPSFFLAETVK